MRTWLKVLEIFGWPNVYLIPPKQFEQVEGPKYKLYHKDPDGSSYTGFASRYEPCITSHHGMRGKKLVNNLAHELLHKVQPWRRHWEIECMAERIAGGGGRGYYSTKYNHTVDDVPSREKVIKSIRISTKRFNARKH